MASAQEEVDIGDSLLDEGESSNQGSSALPQSQPGTPSVTFNHAASSKAAASAPSETAQSAEAEVAPDPAALPLEEREGHAIAKSFIAGNPLTLPDETFHSRWEPAFVAANAAVIETMTQDGAGGVGSLVAELYLAAIFNGSPSTSGDHALTWLNRLIEKKRVARDARTIAALRSQLAARPVATPAVSQTLVVGDSRTAEVAAVKQALSTLPLYDGVKHRTQRELTQHKLALDAALKGHAHVLKDTSTILNCVETRLHKTALDWSQTWRTTHLGGGRTSTFKVYWAAFSKRFSKPNAHLENPLQLLTLSPYDKAVNRAAESIVPFIISIIDREERAERVRLQIPAYTGFSDHLKLALFVNATRAIPKLYKKLLDKQLNNFKAAVDLALKELGKPEYKDAADKIKLDLLAYLCSHCCGLHDTQTCKVSGKPKPRLEAKPKRPPFNRLAALAVEALGIDDDESESAVMAALSNAYEPNSGRFASKRKHEGGRGAGRGRGRGDRGRGDRRGGGRFRGRGRGTYQGASSRFPHGSHGAAALHDARAEPSFTTQELAALHTARAAQEKAAGGAAPVDTTASGK